jgi:outer membrane protein
MSRRLLPLIPLVIALAVPFAFPGTTAAAPTTPGETTMIWVDLDRVVSEVDEGKVATAALGKEQQARQVKIGAVETKLKKLQEKVQANMAKGGTSPAAQQAVADYQQLANDYQQLINQSQKEMLEKEKELFDPIERRVKEVLRSMSTKDGVDIVLGRRAISYARPEYDYTERVTLEYNKVHPTKAPSTTTAAPKASASVAPPSASASASAKK